MERKKISISFLAEIKELPSWKKRYVLNHDKPVDKQERLETWFVYVCASENRHPTKIGISKNLQNRIIQLQDGCASKLAFYFVIPFPTKRDAYDVEQHVLHTASVNGFRLHGEWMNRGVDWVIEQALIETNTRDMYRTRVSLKRSGLNGY